MGAHNITAYIRIRRQESMRSIATIGIICLCVAGVALAEKTVDEMDIEDCSFEENFEDISDGDQGAIMASNGSPMYLELEQDMALMQGDKTTHFVKKQNGTKHLQKYSKKLTKSAALLKVFATQAADEIIDNAKRLGVLGELLKAMSVKSNKSPVEQYVRALKVLRQGNRKGLPRYTLNKVKKNMARGGLITFGKVYGKKGVWAQVNAKQLGLQNNYAALDKIAVNFRLFIKKSTQYAIQSHKLIKHRTVSFGPRDWNKLFRDACHGPSHQGKKVYRGCEKQGTAKSCKSTKFCKWIPAWSGKEMMLTELPEAPFQ